MPKVSISHREGKDKGEVYSHKRLLVVAGIPTNVVKNDSVSTGQVDTQRAGSRGKDEDIHVRARIIESVGQLLSLNSGYLPV